MSSLPWIIQFVEFLSRFSCWKISIKKTAAVDIDSHQFGRYQIDSPFDFTYGACGIFDVWYTFESNDLIQKPDNSPDQHGILRETAMSHWHNQHTSAGTQNNAQ